MNGISTTTLEFFRSGDDVGLIGSPAQAHYRITTVNKAPNKPQLLFSNLFILILAQIPSALFTRPVS